MTSQKRGLKIELALGLIRFTLCEYKLWNFIVSTGQLDLVLKSSIWQGLYLIDWGRGIDLQLFPKNTEFTGDCRTSGFCCIEMQEKKPWTFQASLCFVNDCKLVSLISPEWLPWPCCVICQQTDTYGLCVAVHMMLHNTYMEVERKASDGGYIYLPKSSFKRYCSFIPAYSL